MIAENAIIDEETKERCQRYGDTETKTIISNEILKRVSNRKIVFKMIIKSIIKYTLSCLLIQQISFQLVDQNNKEISLQSFQNDVSKHDFILEYASYTYLMSAFQYFKKQNDEIYKDTIAKIAQFFPKHVSSFYDEKALEQDVL